MDHNDVKVMRFGRWNLFSTGHVLPVIAGGDDPDPDRGAGNGDPNSGPGEGSGTGNGDGHGSGGSDRTFTQADVNSIAASEKEQGRRAALREIEEQLGVKPEEAKRLLDEAREREREKMTDADRKLAEADERDRNAAERERKAAIKERNADVRASLVDKVKGDRLADVTEAVITFGGLPDDGTATPEQITAAIDTTKSKFPEMFGPAKSPSGDPAGAPPNGGQPSVGAIDRGREKARKLQGTKS